MPTVHSLAHLLPAFALCPRAGERIDKVKAFLPGMGKDRRRHRLAGALHGGEQVTNNDAQGEAPRRDGDDISAQPFLDAFLVLRPSSHSHISANKA